ncbi:MAG: c-type cytochrome [Candidatus Methylomirabilales bacterium]
MSVLRSKLVQAVLVVVGMYLVFRFGIQPPAPWSVVKIYMVVVLLAVFVYVSSDSDSWRAFLSPIQSTLLDEGKRSIRNALLVLLPMLVGVYTYTQAAQKTAEPVELRAVHPAPPASITFRRKGIDIQGLDNPFRKDSANYEKYVAEGAAIYIKNCVFCHGDELNGGGLFAHAFNPPPANFRDPGTIAMLQESYLFWRIAKGGVGLPKESTPWNSVMPAWEDRLSEDEIWKVIMYLYDATGYQPRRWEAHASVAPASSRPEPRGPLSVIFSRGVSVLSSDGLAEAQQAGDVTRGKAVYKKKCALCHGSEGQGDGPGAVHLDPKPRDFTRGFYKIRSTGSGQLPTDEDIFRVITEGMPGSSMPSWRHLPASDRRALVAHLKTFSPRFRTEPPGQAIDVGRAIAVTEASIEKGRKLYQLMECFTCHGQAGRRDGESAPTLEDDWGYPIRPANLTKAWTYRGGTTPRDIVVRLLTGLAGTPMPSYEGAVEIEDFWYLATYVRSLSPAGPGYATLVAARPVPGEIPLDPDNPFWSRIPQSNFPLAGQVIVDPRSFSPSIDMIGVRAVYSETEIAFHLTWDDPTFSKSDPGGKTFADQVALQFPAGLQEGTERPYVLMGDTGKPVYLLRWTGDSGVTEANAAGAGKITPQTGDQIQAKGKVVFGDGQYRLVIKRGRATGDPNDLEFPVGRFLSVALMAWDGGAGEVGSKMSLSSWYYLLLEPPPSRTRWLYPPLAALGVVGLELWGLRWARRRARRDG